MKKIFFMKEEGRYVFKENWYLTRILIVIFFWLCRKFRKENYIRNSCMSHEIRTPMNEIAGISEPALDFNLSYSEKKIVRFALLERSLSASSTIFFIFLRLNLANWNDRKYKDYTILVHALKSSVRIIGTENLSKRRNILNPSEISLRPLKVGFLFLKCGLQHWFWPHPGNCCKCFVGCNAIH